ncbi:hypothetical protein EPUS_09491 [Endocarpon pusillum Z07020]|uniref:CorA-like transporter domain-containing protein n=1 Tax=Endocarpon pusillum (strain Z07020 / HMAS-L-300199) TaxID=1263415 RepID=U1G5S1_ENDPU|nr:uncharacterized protein EPUS_09491 [Endocarpon pusillum Z07020]ERF72672.1 hypothetical protein EPUS_09491 [Endocarpon pusillum Z07020]
MASSSVSRFLDAGIPSDMEMGHLFHPSKIRVDKLSLRRLAPRIDQILFNNVQDLKEGLANSGDEVLSFIFLRQQDTWDYIQLSDQAFVYLMRTCQVFTPFWDLVRGFGIKFESKDENIVGLKSKLSAGRSELCYNVRYFEKHNRPGTKAIWSERQVALYHTFDLDDQSSLWIIIQPSKSMELKLQSCVHDIKDFDLLPSDHLDIHALFVSVLASNWRSYINYLEDQLSEVDEKALNSSVGTPCRLDYTVTFRDVQDLELIRRKLLKAALILASNADVGRSLNAHIGKVAQALQKSEIPSSHEVLDQFAADLEMHAKVVTLLLEKVRGTKHRHEEISLTTSVAIRNDGSQIRKLTEQATTASNLMTGLTRKMRNDSKFMKIITFLALLYAPASLAAVR